MKMRSVLVACVAALSFAIDTQGATMTQTLQKDAGANVMYLWSDDVANMTLGSVIFGSNMQGWTVQSSTPGELILSGPTSGPAGAPLIVRNNSGNAGGPSSGNAQSNGAIRLAGVNLAGSPTNARFDLAMNYQSKPFKLEWASVFFDNVTNVVRGFGTVTFSADGWSESTSSTHLVDIPLHPTAAALPLPSAMVFTMSAISLLMLRGMRRRIAV